MQTYCSHWQRKQPDGVIVICNIVIFLYYFLFFFTYLGCMYTTCIYSLSRSSWGNKTHCSSKELAENIFPSLFIWQPVSQEPFPAVTGRRRGQYIRGLTERDNQTLALTPTDNAMSPVHLTCMSLDCNRKLECAAGTGRACVLDTEGPRRRTRNCLAVRQQPWPLHRRDGPE